MSHPSDIAIPSENSQDGIPEAEGSPIFGPAFSGKLKDHEAMTVELEKEFYTASFVASMHLGQHREEHERNFGVCFFTLAMLMVAAIQCMTVLGMAAYLVEKEAGYIGESKLATGLFVNGGATMGLASAADLCGSLSAMPLQHFGGHSSLRLQDGTTYAGTADMPVFHTYKMPSGNWGFDSIGGNESYMDMLLRVLRDAKQSSLRETLLHFRVEYGYLLVAMVAVLWFYVLLEIRKIANFMCVWIHLLKKGLVSHFEETTTIDSEEGKITIRRLNLGSAISGALCLLARACVSTMMLVWGTSLLVATGNKLSLVLNAIAIGIVFELDSVVAYAVIDSSTMSRIESIEPIKCSGIKKRAKKWDYAFSLILFLSVFSGACLVRAWQISIDTQHLQSAAALCLFTGPTPHARQDLVAPVTGFCESLLSMTCAPSVEGPNVHGPCVITNQNIFQRQSIVYPAEGELFKGMYDASGRRNSMARWGSPTSELTNSKTWFNDKNLNAFRKVCVQMYQPSADVDKRIVEPSTGETVYSAPFYCPREKIFQAVFGAAPDNFDKWISTLDMQSPKVVAALDDCQATGAALDVQLPSDERDTDSVSKPALAAIQKPRVKSHSKHKVGHGVQHRIATSLRH